MGDRDAARRALAKAEEGHTAITRYLSYIADIVRRDEVERREGPSHEIG